MEVPDLSDICAMLIHGYFFFFLIVCFYAQKQCMYVDGWVNGESNCKPRVKKAFGVGLGWIWFGLVWFGLSGLKRSIIKCGGGVWGFESGGLKVRPRRE